MFRDAVCARVVSRVMRWVGKLREQAERESQDGAWTALAGSPSPVPIARVGVLLPIPPGALGRLTPGGPKLPPTGGRVARAGPRGPRGSKRRLCRNAGRLRQVPDGCEPTRAAETPRPLRVPGARDDKHKEELLTKAASTPRPDSPPSPPSASTRATRRSRETSATGRRATGP